MKSIQRSIAAAFFAAAFVGVGLGTAACDRQEGPLEEAGESLDDAADEVDDAVDDARR